MNTATKQTNWKVLNWDKRDVDLAKELGCSREYIRQRRKALGKPKSPFHKQHTPSIDAITSLVLIEHPITIKEAEKKTGGRVSANVLRETLKQLGVYKTGYRRVKQRVAQADLWALKDKGIMLHQLAIALGQTNGGLSRLMYGKSADFRMAEAAQKKAIRILKRLELTPTGIDS